MSYRAEIRNDDEHPPAVFVELYESLFLGNTTERSETRKYQSIQEMVKKVGRDRFWRGSQFFGGLGLALASALEAGMIIGLENIDNPAKVAAGVMGMAGIFTGFYITINGASGVDRADVIFDKYKGAQLQICEPLPKTDTQQITARS